MQRHSLQSLLFFLTTEPFWQTPQVCLKFCDKQQFGTNPSCSNMDHFAKFQVFCDSYRNTLIYIFDVNVISRSKLSKNDIIHYSGIFKHNIMSLFARLMMKCFFITCSNRSQVLNIFKQLKKKERQLAFVKN